MSDGESRTLPPTARRRREARRHGPPCRSADLARAAGLVALLGLVYFAAPGFLQDLSAWWADAANRLAAPDFDRAEGTSAVRTVLLNGLEAAAPLGLAAAAATAGAYLLMQGLLWRPQSVKPAPQRLSPGSALRGIFSLEAGARAWWTVAKTGAVCATGAIALAGAVAPGGLLRNLHGAPPEAAALAVSSWVFETALAAAGLLVLLGAGDFVLRRILYERSLRMTPAELREEIRRDEGDPAVRRRRSEEARRLAGNDESGGEEVGP